MTLLLVDQNPVSFYANCPRFSFVPFIHHSIVKLGAQRKARWERAFAELDDDHKVTHEDINRKATIVLEHLMQASDVAHTMQHWTGTYVMRR